MNAAMHNPITTRTVSAMHSRFFSLFPFFELTSSWKIHQITEFNIIMWKFWIKSQYQLYSKTPNYRAVFSSKTTFYLNTETKWKFCHVLRIKIIYQENYCYSRHVYIVTFHFKLYEHLFDEKCKFWIPHK